MKKGLSRLTFSETTRRIITIAIYAFFTIYTLYKKKETLMKSQ